MDLDAWIAHVQKCEPLPEDQLKLVCLHALDTLLSEPNIFSMSAPVTICGDIHGQFHDLLNIFKIAGSLPGTQYIFMGDYVDRGYHSLEVFTYLMLLKVQYPEKICLLRGNHECRQITTIYGFYDEIVRKYGNGSMWRYACELFDALTVAALVDGRILCIHGGLSPSINVLEQIHVIDRRMEIPHEGGFSDLLWSDPNEDITTWRISPRGAGWLFGKRVGQEFSHLNNLDLVCRAHQLVMEGFRYHFKGEGYCTVWSAPNYCYRCGNRAAILRIGDGLERKIVQFVEGEENHAAGREQEAERPTYFV